MEVESRPPPPTQQTPTQPPSASASELMVPFLPRHVRQKYRDQGELKEPVMEAMDFAVLGILDISGYSKLVRRTRWGRALTTPTLTDNSPVCSREHWR